MKTKGEVIRFKLEFMALMLASGRTEHAEDVLQEALEDYVILYRGTNAKGGSVMNDLYWYAKWCTIGFTVGFFIGYGVTSWIIS